MRKLIILCTALMMIALIPAAMAITVDGQKSPGEWDEEWAYGQTQATGYDPNGPFGDRLVGRQGAFSFPTDIWYDEDPKDDSGAGFDESMATLGPSDSGFDIKRGYFQYDITNDTLYGLCTVYGIPGDLDGNNDIGSDCTNNGDCNGTAGPAGIGVGPDETWEVKATQIGTGEVWVLCNTNNWSVFNGIALPYEDVDVKFASTGANPCYEIAIRNMTQYFDIGPCVPPIMIEVKAGGNRDVPGEDTTTAFVHFPCPDIEIVKYVQGNDDVWYDANTPATGPVMANGSDVDWRYVVTNTGDEPLKDVVVTDDQGVTVTCLQDTLDVGETMTCTATGTVLDPCVPYANMGYVEGVGVVSEIMVTDEDPAHYRCPDVPALTPAGLMALIGILGMIGIVGLKRRT